MSLYKDFEYLSESIESILNQTLREFEFIIILDGPSENEKKIIKEYMNVDSRIILIENKTNRGLAYSLNKAIAHSNSEFIARMDGDDISDLRRLEKQYSVMTENPQIDILGTNAEIIDENSNITGNKEYPENDFEIKKILWANPIIHPSVMFKKDKILSIGGYDDSLLRRQDYELWFRSAHNNLTFYNIQEKLIKYRITDQHMIKNNFFKQIDQLKIGIKGIRKLKSPWFTYIAILLPLIKSIFPKRIQKKISVIFLKYDPRGR